MLELKILGENCLGTYRVGKLPLELETSGQLLFK